MKRVKVYLDTSVISHLDQQDVPDRMRDTWLLWEAIKKNEYDIIISEVTLDELTACPEPKQTTLFTYLLDIQYDTLIRNPEVERLAQSYIDYAVLPAKCIVDCLHIAFASISECDLILSWNFKHMVKYKTISGIRAVNAIHMYSKGLDILQPSVLISKEDESYDHT